MAFKDLLDRFKKGLSRTARLFDFDYRFEIFVPPAKRRWGVYVLPFLYGDRLILKLFRRLEEGVNPDLEIGRFLTERGFPNIPPVAGALEYRRTDASPATMAVSIWRAETPSTSETTSPSLMLAPSRVFWSRFTSAWMAARKAKSLAK